MTGRVSAGILASLLASPFLLDYDLALAIGAHLPTAPLVMLALFVLIWRRAMAAELEHHSPVRGAATRLS